MPATHAELVNNAGNFLGQYTMKWSADTNNMTEVLRGADCNTLENPSNRYVGVADVAHSLTSMANRCRVTPKNVNGRLWSWFKVEAGGTSSWGATQGVELDAKIKLYQNAQAVPNVLNNLDRRAYCLPYANNRIAGITLGNDANFFFTDALSGCTVFIHRPAGGAVTVYHANATGVAQGNKNSYMEQLFQHVAGVPASNQHVLNFASLRYMAEKFDTPAHLQGKVSRKKRQLRKNVKWTVMGASVVGHRTGNNQWDFFWQVLGIMEYDRPGIDNVIQKLKGKETRDKHVYKTSSLSVLASGQI